MVTAPNQLWCMDFKGYFLTGDGYRCDPFTITDAHSRFLIRCQAVARMDFAQVNAVAILRCASTACQNAFAPTTEHHSPVSGCLACPSYRWDG